MIKDYIQKKEIADFQKAIYQLSLLKHDYNMFVVSFAILPVLVYSPYERNIENIIADGKTLCDNEEVYPIDDKISLLSILLASTSKTDNGKSMFCETSDIAKNYIKCLLVEEINIESKSASYYNRNQFENDMYQHLHEERMRDM